MSAKASKKNSTKIERVKLSKEQKQARLFDDEFVIEKINPDGKKFDKVSRLKCTSCSMDGKSLLLDVNTDIYKLQEGDKFNLLLVSTLSLDGKEDDGYFDQDGRRTLLDDYDYGMHGKVFKYAHDDKENTVSIYASFGGLLMLLQGKQHSLKSIQLDSAIYLLMKKTLEER